ncbi:amino acid ABC transporter permease [Shinella daejeonensis]|uniref:amino acid ABC transporter permease n=1 Tax=Shinella daejeonensis TaxID=659017 RepID=UPI0020C7604C|nr:amino acid ABC transporter permease [Shinella daejeonensis]MCP8897466.1 amino acid ABC transporter permease [Shinella daejeonensis]
MSWDFAILILSGLPWTIVVTIGAFAMGLILGAPLCAMHISRNPILHFLALAIIIFLRSIPPIVWVFLLFFGLGSGFISIGAIPATIIALGVVTAANMAEIYRGSLSSIHAGQWEAISALGLPPVSSFKDIILPQLFRVTLPSAASYLIGLFKDSAIASTVGVMDIAFLANFVARKSFDGLTPFAFAAVLYILISIPIALVARIADARLRQKVAQ